MSKVKQQSINAILDELLAGYRFEDQPIHPDSLSILEREASIAGINLNSASEQMFRVSPEALTRGQGQKLFEMLAAEVAKTIKPRHCHYCVECGDSMVCFEPEGCTETEDECRSCHEGFRPGEWNAYERRLAQKGLL